MLALLAVVAIAAICGLTFVAVNSRLMPGPTLTGKTLVIHTKKPDDQSIRGVLQAQHADRVTLREAVYLHKGGTSPVMGGLVHIPLSAISWMQEIDPVEEVAAE
jgi:hypothetical protein